MQHQREYFNETRLYVKLADAYGRRNSTRSRDLECCTAPSRAESSDGSCVEPLSSRTLTWVTNIAHDPFVEDEERTRRGRGELQSLQLHGLCRRDECIDKLHRVKLQRRMQRLQRELEEQTK